LNTESAKLAFDNAKLDATDIGFFEIFWHKSKASLKMELIDDINI